MGKQPKSNNIPEWFEVVRGADGLPYDEVRTGRLAQKQRFSDGIIPKWAKGVYHFTYGKLGARNCVILETHFTRDADASRCASVIATQKSKMFKRLGTPDYDKPKVRVYFKAL